MAEATDKAGDSKGKPGAAGMLGKFKIPLIVGAVILVQCGLAAMYLPGSSSPTAKADPVGEAEDAVAAELATEEDQDAPSSTEIDLGEFKLTAFRIDSNSTWFIDFHLWGTIKATDEKDFTERYEGTKNRIREQVLVIVRSLNRDDFADASLGLIKRQILEKTNKTLGKPLVRSVVFSDFSFVEQ